MRNLKRKVIYCPKKEQHAHPKIILLIDKDKLTLHCHEHEFMDIQLIKGGEIMDFSNVSAKVVDVRKGTHFDLEELPVVACGKFKTKKQRKYAHN